MFIKGTQISLRAMEPEDAELLYTWENNRELWSVSQTQLPFSKFVLDEFVNAAHQDIYTNKQLRLMVVLNASNEIIGATDLFEFDPQHNHCGIGIYIHENHQGKGYGKECIELIKLYCFETLHLKQVFAHISEHNNPSLKLFADSGFEKTGVKKYWHKTGIDTYSDVFFLQCFHPGE